MPDPIAVDPVAGVVAWLKARPAIAALLGTRVFGGEMPAGEARHMPRKALVVKPSGGPPLTGEAFAGFDAQRIDLFAFGETPREANAVMLQAALELRQLRRAVAGGVLLIACNSAGGHSADREPGTEWPRSFRSFQLVHGLEAA